MKPRAPGRPTARNQRNSSRRQRKQQHLLDVKVRSRAATRHRNRRVLALISAVFLFCAAVAGIAYGGHEALRRFFWENPDYNLADVAIHTDGSLSREQIIAATKIQEGVNIFTINLSAARKGLVALPQVERADIDRILPNKISIDIAERKPVAWVTAKEDSDPSTDAGAYLIDHNGILMRIKTPASEDYHLPVICGVAVDNYEEGEKVDLPEMKAALQLIHLTGENPARYQVRSIDVSKGYCLVATDERHAKITFPLENIGAQLDRLAMLFASVDASSREIQTVNLLVQRNVPVTFAPPPDPEPADAPAGTQPAPPSVAQPPPNVDAKRAQFLSATGRAAAAKRAQALHKSAAHKTPATRKATPVSQDANTP